MSQELLKKYIKLVLQTIIHRTENIDILILLVSTGL